MSLNRREFVVSAGAAAAGAALLAGCDRQAAGPLHSPEEVAASAGRWQDVRAAFALSPDTIHMSAMLISSHPRPVREAIERHRRGLDRDPVTYLEDNHRPRMNAAREAAANYLGVGTDAVALTDSTTMGVGLVYNGLRLRPGDEIVSTEQDYYVTIEALRLLAERSGARVVQVPLYERTETLGPDEAVARILAGVTPRTRVVALTWVHSSTGYKLPARAVADAIAELNRDRPEERRILFCLDGVHGFGVEDFTLADLGCDFFMAGCHKWLFGPRGTGIVAAGPLGFEPLIPAIPSFIEQGGGFDAWITGEGDPGPNNGARMTPGGFKAFEHKWALAEAFEWQSGIGKARVAERTHALARRLKEGLRGIDGVTLLTPMEDDRSAGIVSFDIDGMSPDAVVSRLRQRKIIASVAPYAIPHVRLTPSIRNSAGEVDVAIEAVRALA
ncbi:MAG: aminotransferase class V-fold PLP-dependent enzyme [Allosphingosinicella sp.]|uniref:aminotransferase class V-fold PLP-dependent enzyme n=1 Tax=Allosphingosinicella sp. TaxID=2823234 RepID=UPI0039630E6F